MALNLLNLPHELLHAILCRVDPIDLTSLRCCHALDKIIYGNELLHKHVFLNHFDEPPVTDISFSWTKNLGYAIRLRHVLECEDVDVTRLPEVVKLVHRFLNLATSKSKSSANTQYLDRLLCLNQSTKRLLYLSAICTEIRPTPGLVQTQTEADDGTSVRVTRSRSTRLTDPVRQASAQLACLYGMPNISEVGAWEGPDPSRLRSHARAKIYNMKNYHFKNDWGPFTDEGSEIVDWEKLEAIAYQILLGTSMISLDDGNGQKISYQWGRPFLGSIPNSFVSPDPYTDAAEPSPYDSDDPYGITGTWDRIVCFLDYTDFYHFNFFNQHTPRPEPREPIEVEEAIILIRMKLKVTKIEPIPKESSVTLPVVHFRGTASLLPPYRDPTNGSAIRGTVRPTPEGEVRWTSISVFHGEERWKSEGIQIGGPRSARGVLGTWFDKDYDEHGPVGPTAFWKINDSIEKDP